MELALKSQRIELTDNFSPDETQCLKLFSSHFKEFWANFEELRQSGFDVNWEFERRKDGVISSGPLPCSTHRLKGFFLDYRKFHQQSEPIQFLKVCNILCRRCEKKALKQLIKRHKHEWKSVDSPVIGWGII